MKTTPAMKRFFKDIAFVLVMSSLLVVIFTYVRLQRNKIKATPFKAPPCILSQAGFASNYDPVTTVGTVHVYMNCSQVFMGWGCYGEQSTYIYKWVNGQYTLVYASPITTIGLDCGDTNIDIKTISVMNAWGIPGDHILMQSVIRTGVLNVEVGFGEVSCDL